MNKRSLFGVVSFLSVSSLIVPAVFAVEAVPVSKCVTAKTKATHVSVMARMEKDVAPYAQNPAAAVAIQAYREAMATAWEAMNEPYCGYGVYGAASAVKSYSKSVERARVAFVTAVKNLTKAKVEAMAPVKVPEVKLASAPTSTPSVPGLAVSGKFVAEPVKPGLHIGMRTETVKNLQKKLASYYDLAEDSLVTGYFGPKTEGLVIKFQLEKKIIESETSPGAGMVGPRTAAALNQL